MPGSRISHPSHDPSNGKRSYQNHPKASNFPLPHCSTLTHPLRLRRRHKRLPRSIKRQTSRRQARGKILHKRLLAVKIHARQRKGLVEHFKDVKTERGRDECQVVVDVVVGVVRELGLGGRVAG